MKSDVVMIAELADPSPLERDAMTALWVETWKATFPAIDFDARRAWLLSRFSDHRAVVARPLDGQLLGFALFDGTLGKLDQIAVHPNAFGRGVAVQILDAVKAACAEGVSLDVNADNPRAVAFYRREGFVQTGEGRNSASGLRTISMQWRRAP